MWLRFLQAHQVYLLSLSDTIKGFNDLVNGKYDNVPESAFYMVGTIEEALEKKAKKLKNK